MGAEQEASKAPVGHSRGILQRLDQLRQGLSARSFELLGLEGRTLDEIRQQAQAGSEVSRKELRRDTAVVVIDRRRQASTDRLDRLVEGGCVMRSRAMSRQLQGQ